MYTCEFSHLWEGYFQPLDEAIKDKIKKKVDKILEYPQKRHLKRSKFFVAEVGQYRITYRIFEENNLIRFYFVGDHKEYEKWYQEYSI